MEQFEVSLDAERHGGFSTLRKLVANGWRSRLLHPRARPVWHRTWVNGARRGFQMIANYFADLTGAERLSNRKWRTICPLHGEQSRSLQISGGQHDNVDLKCDARCPIHEIAKAFGLSWEELTSQPLLAPDETIMEDEEIAAVRAQCRQRQERHKACCEQMREQEKLVAKLRKWLNSSLAGPSRAESKQVLGDARRTLRVFREQERSLRAPGTCPKRAVADGHRGLGNVDLAKYVERVNRARRTS